MRHRYLAPRVLALSCVLAAATTAFVPAAAQAKDKHTADVQVVNKTGRGIEFVTVAHKYSDDYKNSKTWGNTDPKNFREIVDAAEKFAKEALPAAGKVVGSIVAGDAGGAVGGKAAEEMGALLLNSESTVGFKQHILREEDSREKSAVPTVIGIGDKEVKFKSPSGESSTGFAPVKAK